MASYDPALPGPRGWQYQVDPGVFSSILRATLLWLQGFPDLARRDLEAGLQLTQRMPHPPSQALARLLAATILCHLGRDMVPIARLVQVPPQSGETTVVLDGLRDLLAVWQQTEAQAAMAPAGGDGQDRVNSILLRGRPGWICFTPPVPTSAAYRSC